MNTSNSPVDFTPAVSPSAREVARRVYPHLAAHLHHAAEGAQADLPSVGTIETILDTAFWVSLRREEGFTPRITLAYVRPEQLSEPMRFERPLPFHPPVLARVSPAVERPGIHLGVRGEPGSLEVWGATRDLPPHCFVVEVIAPGLLVIKHSRAERGTKYVNLAVLEGDQVKVIDQHATAPECPALLMSLLGLESPAAISPSVNVLVQLAVSMRAHGRGGTLLVVPSDTVEWRDSILLPITYSVQPAFSLLTDLMQPHAKDKAHHRWQDAVHGVIEALAGLTAVDGATVISDSHQLLAFGAKIVRRRGCEQVGEVMLTEPIEGSKATVVEPAYLGGTRHLSAAQFTSDQRSAIALVASQDGRFTVFGWSGCDDLVQAHRIETLLL